MQATCRPNFNILWASVPFMTESIENLETPSKAITLAAAQFVLLALLSLIPGLTVFLAIVLAFSFFAWRNRESRGFLVLAAGFFGCMLIRELDHFLDRALDGLWSSFVALLAMVSIAYARAYCRGAVLRPLIAFLNTKPYFFFLIGFVIVLIFARVFGSGNLLWEHVLNDAYTDAYKSSVQEGLELFGYLLIAYGAFLFLKDALSDPLRLRNDSLPKTQP